MNQISSGPTNCNFTLEESLSCRDSQAFAHWLDQFLRGPGLNVPLADGLLKQPRWWIKPEQRILDTLTFKCGPGREFHEPEEVWRQRIEVLAQKIQTGLPVLPLIAEFKADQLLLADGNHRCGALLHLRIPSYWTAIWFNSEEDHLHFLKMDRKASVPDR